MKYGLIFVVMLNCSLLFCQPFQPLVLDTNTTKTKVTDSINPAIKYKTNGLNQEIDDLVLEDTFNALNLARYSESSSAGSYSAINTATANGVYEFSKWENTTFASKTIELDPTYDVLLRTNGTTTSNNTYATLGSITQDNSTFGRIGALSEVVDITVSSSASIIHEETNATTLGGYFLSNLLYKNISYFFTSTGTKIYNITVPTTPVYLGAISTGYTIDGVIDETEDNLFVTTNNGYIRAININDPTTPTILDSLLLSYPSALYGITLTGNYLYVVADSGPDALVVIDKSDPTSLVEKGSITTTDNIALGNALIEYPYVFVQGMVFDVSDPNNPFIKNDIISAYQRYSVIIGYYYFWTTGTSILVYDWTDLNNITLVETFALSGAQGITKISDNYLFVVEVNGDSVYLVDCSDPTNLVLDQTITDATQIDTQDFNNPDCENNYCVIGNGDDDSFTIFNVSGYYEPTVTTYEGLSRQFIAFNTTDFFTLDQTTEIGNATIIFDSMTNSLGSEYVEVFVYDPTTGSNIITNVSHTATQLQTFWEDTGQPFNSSFQTDITSNFQYLNVTSISNLWLNKRSSTNYLLCFGLQVSVDSTNIEYLQYENISLYIQWNPQIADVTTASLSTSIHPVESFTTAVDFIYTTGSTATWASNTNYLQFTTSIETTNGTDLFQTYFLRAIVYDPSGAVYLSWKDISGNTNTYSVGVTLEKSKGYRFSFEIDKSNSKWLFGIYDTTGEEIKRLHSWSSYVTNEQTQKPAFFIHDPLEKDWLTADTSIANRGYRIDLTAGGTYVITGVNTWSIDRLYASQGLLQEEWICSPYGDGTPSTACQYSTNNSNQFDHTNPLGVTYTTLDYNQSTVQYSKKVYDFRSFAGLYDFENKYRFDPADPYIYSMYHYIKIFPYKTDGTIDIATSVSVAMGGLYVGGAFDYTFLYILLSNNITYQIDYGGSKETDTSPLPEIQLGFGFSFFDEKTLQLQVNSYNYSANNDPLNLATYETLSDSFTNDVLMETYYFINGSITDTTNTGSITIKNEQLLFGNLPFTAPAIPTPKEPWVKPKGSSIFGISIPRFTLPDFNFPSLPNFGNVWGQIVNVITDIWDIIINLPNILGGIAGSIITALLGALTTGLILIIDFLLSLLPQEAEDWLRQWQTFDWSILLDLMLNIYFWILATISLLILWLTFYIWFLPFLECDFDLFEGIGTVPEHMATTIGFDIFTLPIKAPAVVWWFALSTLFGYILWLIPFELL